MRTLVRCALGTALTLSVLAAPAAASDGVIEINQARALAGGVTAGDAPGFPVTISSPGSYLLTGNLDTGAASAIEITAPDVTLDLGGFKIVGNFSSDTAVGISSSFVATRVRDGVVQLFRGGCILLSDSAVVENVRASSSNGSGISVGDHSQVRDCEVISHLGRGIWAGANARITGNIAEDCFIGVRADGGVISGNSVSGSGNIGIHAEGNTTLVTGNAVRGSYDTGIAMSAAVGYSGNAVAGATTNVNGGLSLGPNMCGTGLCP